MMVSSVEIFVRTSVLVSKPLVSTLLEEVSSTWLEVLRSSITSLLYFSSIQLEVVRNLIFSIISSSSISLEVCPSLIFSFISFSSIRMETLLISYISLSFLMMEIFISISASRLVKVVSPSVINLFILLVWNSAILLFVKSSTWLVFLIKMSSL